MDQRPMNSTIRYRRVLWYGCQDARRWIDISSSVSAISLVSGTTLLAKKIRPAINHEPLFQNRITPLMMVLRCTSNSSRVSRMGSRLVGLFWLLAVFCFALVRVWLCGLRACSRALQRGQCMSVACSGMRHSRLQVEQVTRPRAAAETVAARG